MKTKILIPAAIIMALTLAVAGTYAATTNISSWTSTPQGLFSGKGFGGMGGHRGGMLNLLTDAEKTALTSMTLTERQVFFEKKRTEMEAKREAHETVIDKLLAGTTLTAEEETLRAEIVKNRAERKIQREKMDTIRTKVQAGTTLTAEEQALVDSMPRGGQGGKGGKMRGGMHNGPMSNTRTE